MARHGAPAERRSRTWHLGVYRGSEVDSVLQTKRTLQELFGRYEMLHKESIKASGVSAYIVYNEDIWLLALSEEVFTPFKEFTPQ